MFICSERDLLVENVCFVFQKYILRQNFMLSLVLSLFLIFHQISGSCSYKIILIKRVYFDNRATTSTFKGFPSRHGIEKHPSMHYGIDYLGK